MDYSQSHTTDYYPDIWIINNQLVRGFKPSEKYEFVNWDDENRDIWRNKKCSKPPTRYDVICPIHIYIYSIYLYIYIYVELNVHMFIQP